jgi:hypothetical protein
MSDCIGEGCTHASHNHPTLYESNNDKPVPETRIYRGEECPIVKFDKGPFKNRIYVRFRGNLVHVGDRKMIAVPVKKYNMHTKQEEFMNSKED